MGVKSKNHKTSGFTGEIKALKSAQEALAKENAENLAGLNDIKKALSGCFQKMGELERENKSLIEYRERYEVLKEALKKKDKDFIESQSEPTALAEDAIRQWMRSSLHEERRKNAEFQKEIEYLRSEIRRLAR